jgi:hypothetical protein
MKLIIKYNEMTEPPTLELYIHGAPHKREHRKSLQRFREELTELAVRKIGDKVDLPIDWPIDLKVVYSNPNSPDMDHLLEATFMALDGKSLKGPSILTDDRYIQKATISKYYANPPTKRDGAR